MIEATSRKKPSKTTTPLSVVVCGVLIRIPMSDVSALIARYGHGSTDVALR